MTWRPAERTTVAKQIYAAAEKDRADRPERYRLDVAAITERAETRCSSELFAPGWQTGLDAFLGSAAEEARLNAVGIRMAAQSAVGRLTAGAAIAGYRRDHPEAASATLAPPIVIIGGWRTGTTFLFRLLGTDPRLHAPLPAELVSPWVFADGSGPEKRTGTAAATELLHTLNPQMAHVHPSGPTLPEECVLGMGTDLRNWGFTSMMRLPSYADWLADQDFTAPYLRYREALQLLSVHDPRRFVLKAPAHTAELDRLIAAFPGAVIVQIHRDIVHTLASGASLFAVYRSTYSDEVDALEVGRQQLDQSELWFRRAAAVRASTGADRATFVDIDYDDLVDRPAEAIGRVYDAAGLAPPAPVDEFVAAYHAAHPRDAHGAHRYSPADFGIDPDDVRERFAFVNG
ncbi:MAG: sulfotransferase [Mycobacterium sp.]|nr:sulfotransferase [Mycobacterium sp.]